jgi:lipopolysaccharide/colanic/teichoic acid biosynthesis glycosyltransferase
MAPISVPQGQQVAFGSTAQNQYSLRRSARAHWSLNPDDATMNDLRESREQTWTNGESGLRDASVTSGVSLDSIPVRVDTRESGCAVAIPAWKHLLDVTCIALSLPVVLPAALIIALGIKIVSPGPILFAQERVGYMGRRFKCWKFRSMKVGADTSAHKEHTAYLMRSSIAWTKMDEVDPRVIPLGALLRSTGLDELPQLINVLRGDMSLVGPRPCTPYEFANYLPWQKQRFDGLPGLTGLWQVSGKNKTTFEQMVEIDIHYVTNMSIWSDLRIIFKTVPTLLGQVVEMLTKPRDKTMQPTRNGNNTRRRL